jgi:glucose-fructose oxidoreductase
MALFGEERDSRKIRYAVVGLGSISQMAVLPAFKNAKNSELAALVTDDPRKAEELGKTYDVSRTTNYQGYDDLLRSGSIDAVYIGLPNSMHKDFSVRAARAGVHVLCEKPMAASVAECEQMIRAAEENRVKLMIAYRLHFEPANLRAIEMLQKGEIGEPKIFSSVFSLQVKEGNIRVKKDLAGGPLMDLGVYPINASRYLFRDEPIEVTGIGANTGDPRFTEVHETATGILRFPGDRLAVFTCSFGAAAADGYQVVGTKAELWLRPAYDYHEPLKLTLKAAGKEHATSFDKLDQFGPELEYFAQCILDGTEPEPSGQEGLADMRVVEALLESMRSGHPVKLERFEKKTRPGEEQKFEKSPVKAAKVVHAQLPN